MILMTIAVFVLLNIGNCSTDLSFLNKIKRVLGKEMDDKSIKGTIKPLVYLGSVLKMPCFGWKHPTQWPRHLSWYHSGKKISRNQHYSIDRYGTLTIQGVSVDDSGEFICRVSWKTVVHKFKYDVSVVQFPSRSLHIRFVYTMRICTTKNEAFASLFIESKVRGSVCLENECKLGYIHSTCHVEKFSNSRLIVTVPILVSQIPNKRCNIECSRQKLNRLQEEVKQKAISSVMHGSRLKIREEPREMPISFLETEEDTICNPGFEMKGTLSRSLCVPCAPGHFLERGYCIPCHLNHYNEKFASTECRPCFGNRVTRRRGARSEDDCYMVDPDFLWIVFGVTLMPVPLIAVCFLCRCRKLFLRRSNEESDGQRNPKQHKRSTPNVSTSLEKSSKSKTENLKLPSSKQRKSVVSNPSFVMPSVRHSSGKEFFQKPNQTRNKSRIPPPPPLPTDSMLKLGTRNETYPIDPSHNDDRRKLATALGQDRSTSTSTKMEDDTVPSFNERYMKNKPMYNAYMKSKL